MTDDSEDDTEAAPEAAPARRGSARKPSIRTPLDPLVAAGLGRCLRARLNQLDRDIAHAKELAVKEPFYAHSAENLVKIRVEAAKHLVEFEGVEGEGASPK